MKTINFLLAVIVLTSTISYAQNLSTVTNEMHLNLSENRLPNTGKLPIINWLYPKFEYTNSEESKIEIVAETKSEYPLKELKIVIGDKVSGNSFSTKVYNIGKDAKEYSLRETITLPPGSNFVEVVATNADGVTVSSLRNILVGKSTLANAVSIDRKDYAVLFVTDKYDYLDDLVNPIDDGNTIAKELKEKYGFDVEIVKNPTVEEVWEKLRDYNTKKFKPQDQLLVFFAGHGNFDETFGEGYVVAKNSLKKDESRNSYISHNRLRGVINNIPCEHIFLVMDVCYGGTFDPVLARSRSLAEYTASTTEVIVRKLSHRTRKYLTSGGKEYVSDGIPGKHSPFAAMLIESLRSYGGEDGMLTIAELQLNLEKLKLAPRFGSFGDDDQLSDFIFISKNIMK